MKATPRLELHEIHAHADAVLQENHTETRHWAAIRYATVLDVLVALFDYATILVTSRCWFPSVVEK